MTPSTSSRLSSSSHKSRLSISRPAILHRRSTSLASLMAAAAASGRRGDHWARPRRRRLRLAAQRRRVGAAARRRAGGSARRRALPRAHGRRHRGARRRGLRAATQGGARRARLHRRAPGEPRRRPGRPRRGARGRDRGAAPRGRRAQRTQRRPATAAPYASRVEQRHDEPLRFSFALSSAGHSRRSSCASAASASGSLGGVNPDYAAPSMVEALLRAGARVDGVDARGETALHAAARAGDAGNVAALLGAGAAVNARSRAGETALAVLRAARRGGEKKAGMVVAGGSSDGRPAAAEVGRMLVERGGVESVASEAVGSRRSWGWRRRAVL